MTDKLWITTHNPETKMEGYRSLNLYSSYCEKLHCIEGSVCRKCYWFTRYIHYYRTLKKHMVENAEILSSVLDKDEDPVLNDCFFRVSSFGDVENQVQIMNIVDITDHYEHTRFGWWTKRYELFNGMYIPDNVNLIFSSFLLNEPLPLSELPRATKIFTVYDDREKFAKAPGFKCNGKKCIQCLRCYTNKKREYIKEFLR